MSETLLKTVPESAPVHAQPPRLRSIPSGLRRVLIALGFMLGSIGAVAASYALWHRITPVERTDNAYVKSDISFVGSRVAGHVQEILTENNRKVRRREVLAQIDPRDYDAAVMTAEAEVARGKATLAELGSRLTLQHAQIARAEATLQAARANAERAGAEHKRVAALIEPGWTTRQRYEEVVADDIQAQSSVAEAEAQLRWEREQISVIEAGRAAATAVLQGAEAHLYKARLDRESTVIRSPVDGIVASRQADIGEYVAVGTRLLAIVPTDGLYVEANFRETQLYRIRPGDRVMVSVDALRGARLCGTVESLPGASGAELSVLPPDNATGNFTKIVRRFPVRIRLDTGQPALARLRSGMSVVPSVLIDTHERDRPALLGRFACRRLISSS